MKVTITLTLADLEQAVRSYAVGTLDVPEEVAAKLVLQIRGEGGYWYDAVNRSSPLADETVRAFAEADADRYTEGPFR